LIEKLILWTIKNTNVQTMKTYKVLYNACYGGFDLDHRTLLGLFRRFRPHTSLGKEVWQGCACTLEASNIITRETIILPGYTQLYFVKPPASTSHRDPLYIKHSASGSVWNLATLSDYIHRFRAHQLLVEHLEDAGAIGRPMGIGLLHIAVVPLHCSYRITEYDGQETVHIEIPVRQALVDLLHLLGQTGIPAETTLPLHPWTEALLRGEVDLSALDI
jgi:hypothetical protein